MAITVSTRPSEYSNSAIFITSTDVAEDSTHVNTRIDAELYVDGVVIAKKTKPKGITTFDFTDILNSKIKFTNPKLVDDSTTDTQDPGKTGSNLITSWTEDAGAPFKTFTVSGANWTKLESADPDAVAKCYTNTIAVTAGYIYVIIFKFVLSEDPDGPFTIRVKTTSTNGNVISRVVDDKRMYFQPRTTGNIQLEVVDNGIKGYDWSGNWEMYLLNTTDWWTPYYVKFTEYYEDASGVTTTGATSTETTLNLFFKSDATTFTNYICFDSNGKFLKVDGYYKAAARTYQMMDNPTTRTSSHEAYILDKRLYQSAASLVQYNTSGTPQTRASDTLLDRYSPILVMYHTNNDVSSTYPYCDNSVIKAADTVCTESLTKYAVLQCFPDQLHLIWYNTKGGFSAYTFLYNIKKTFTVDKEFYLDVDKKDRLIPDSVVKKNRILASTELSNSENKMGYFDDLLYSPLVYWQRGANDLVQVTVKSADVTHKIDNELVNFEVEVEW